MKASEIVGQADDFVIKKSKSPLWGFAWALFLASGGYLGHVVWLVAELPATLGEQGYFEGSNRDRLSSSTAARESLTVLTSLVLTAAHSDVLTTRPDSLRASIKTIDVGLRRIRELRPLLAGLEVADNTSESILDKHLKDVEDLERYIEQRGREAAFLLERGTPSSLEQLRHVYSVAKIEQKREAQLDRLISLNEAFGARASGATKEFETALATRKAKLRSMKVQAWLAIPALGYVIGFAMAVVTRWRSTLRPAPRSA
jgi:hypothetical protein